MAKTAFKIVGIQDVRGDNYVVGQEIENLGPITKILYNRPDNPYNKGFQLSGASYTVFTDDATVRILIRQEAVLKVIVLREEVAANPEEEVALAE